MSRLFHFLHRTSFQAFRRFSVTSSALKISATATLQHVELKERDLRLHWSESSAVDVLYLFLRDNCTEPQSYNQSSKMRTFNPAFTVDLHLKAKAATVSPDGKKLTITWSDDHQSNYMASWLAERCEGETDCTGRLASKRLWDKSTSFDQLPSFKYSAIVGSDITALLDMLLGIEVHGLVTVLDCDCHEGFAEEFATMAVGFPYRTTYGNWRSVEVKGPASVDKTPLCTELPSYQYIPPISAIHCTAWEKLRSGASLFSDGFRAAEELRKRNPKAFNVLSEMPVYFRDESGPQRKHATETWQTTISVDEDGNVVQVAVNDEMRTPHVAVDFRDRLGDWYDAYHEFTDLLEESAIVLRRNMKPREMVLKDNFRILQGSESLEVSEGGRRRFEIAYLGWDEARSKARVLQNKLFRDKQ